jgi:hypothetical protein
VLYNNSSAMYEKAKMYSDAILDSNIVLSMDPKHTKARIRRSRVYEALVSHRTIDRFSVDVCLMCSCLLAASKDGCIQRLGMHHDD